MWTFMYETLGIQVYGESHQDLIKLGSYAGSKLLLAVAWRPTTVLPSGHHCPVEATTVWTPLSRGGPPPSGHRGGPTTVSPSGHHCHLEAHHRPPFEGGGGGGGGSHSH